MKLKSKKSLVLKNGNTNSTIENVRNVGKCLIMNDILASESTSCKHWVS
jgi:hypothetical protein